MKIIETVRYTYLCESSEEKGEACVLQNAVRVATRDDAGGDEDPRVVARDYIRAIIVGEARTIKLKNASIESEEEAEEETVLVELMRKYLPIAEKNARAAAILAALDNLLDREEREE